MSTKGWEQSLLAAESTIAKLVHQPVMQGMAKGGLSPSVCFCGAFLDVASASWWLGGQASVR